MNKNNFNLQVEWRGGAQRLKGLGVNKDFLRTLRLSALRSQGGVGARKGHEEARRAQSSVSHLGHPVFHAVK